MSEWLATLQAQLLAGPGAGCMLVVAVSGGGDSVALLHGLARLRESLRLRLVVAHLDHALRPDSASDAAFVGQLALALRLPCLRERRDIPAQLAAEKGNMEEVARRARYQMLESAARAVRADAIAVAHTADDQAETLLMHLLRGAGLDGLKGMMALAPPPLPNATTPIFRPLLLVERATLRAWLAAQGLPWRDNADNEDTALLRNRLRHHLIPLLEQEQPRLRLRLAHTAQRLGEDYDWLASATDALWPTLAAAHADRVRLARATFLAQPVALQRRLLRRAFFHLRPTARDLSSEQVTRALAVAARGATGARATLPGGLFVRIEHDGLWVEPQARADASFPLAAPLLLDAPGSVTGAGLTLTLDPVGRDALPGDWRALPPAMALLDAEALRWPLALRCPLPDDRWSPLGMGGQEVRLRDWLAKHKVPPARRGSLPLLVDGAGRVLWVVGWQVGHVAHVRPASQKLLRATVAGPGEPFGP